jgi:hypothetical protein
MDVDMLEAGLAALASPGPETSGRRGPGVPRTRGSQTPTLPRCCARRSRRSTETRKAAARVQARCDAAEELGGVEFCLRLPPITTSMLDPVPILHAVHGDLTHLFFFS